jgi:large subunit ribosomal protein L24
MKIKSVQPRKQRKFLYNAPIHLRRKIVAAHMSKDLKQRFKIRSFPLRKGDEVEVMKGKFRKKRGKVTRIDYKYYQVFVEGMTRKRTAGTEVQVPFHASNLRIINLEMGDKMRVKSLERKIKAKEGKEVKQEMKQGMKQEAKKEK